MKKLNYYENTAYRSIIYWFGSSWRYLIYVLNRENEISEKYGYSQFLYNVSHAFTALDKVIDVLAFASGQYDSTLASMLYNRAMNYKSKRLGENK